MNKKKFDCVEMKHEAAKKINQRLTKMTREQELEYWRQKTAGLHHQQTRLRKKLEKV